MKIEIHTDKIYHKDKCIKDPKEIAKIIGKCISHLGLFNIYYNLKPKKWWQRLLYYIGECYK